MTARGARVFASKEIDNLGGASPAPSYSTGAGSQQARGIAPGERGPAPLAGGAALGGRGIAPSAGDVAPG